MASKKVRIGVLIATQYDKITGKKRKSLSLALGNKGKDERYDNTVEVIVRDNLGNVIAKQTDGFLNLVDPREEPSDLLAAGLIDEAQAAKMQENASKIKPKIRYHIRMNKS